MKRILLVLLTSILVKNAAAQFSFSCAKNTTIDCSQNCVTLQTTIPDIHTFSDDYGVSLISGPGGCFRPPVNPGTPGVSTNLSLDDRYTPTIPLPFLFSFYGIYYLQCTVNTNGIISFDLTNSSTNAQWIIQGLDGSLPSTDYDRAIIMGAFHDIDISRPESPTRQIKYDVLGTAPHRKWVLSFYKVPCFDCNNEIDNTYQITLYEGLSLVEVHVFARDVCTTWNAGAAMIGMQNYNQNSGVMAPGRSAFTTPRWQGPTMNEAWRFTPKQGPSLFKKVELTDLSGTVVATGTTAPGTNNDIAVTFDNICPAATTTYLVKSSYYNLEYPFQFPARDSIIYGIDTITVYKNGSIPALNVSTTPAVCGPNPNGTINIAAPVGPNYEYSIDGGTNYQPGNSFSVLPGTYTVTIHDITGTCTKDTTVIVGSPATFTATATSTNTSSPTASNGTITITPSIAGTFTYDIDNSGTFVNSNIFTGLTAGEHNISVKDAGGCAYGFLDTVLSDPGFTTIATASNASCSGLSNGSITVTVPASGQAPFTYQVGTTVQPANPVFSALLGDSTYTVIVTDNIGCADTFPQVVTSNPSVTASFGTLGASCIGVDNGRIVITPSGGTGPYFYDTTGTGTFTALDTLRNLGFGTYNVTIRDNIGCRFTLPAISISIGDGVRASYDIVNSACTAASTGRIIITTSEGTFPFTYSVNNGGYVPLDTIRNLAPGPYSVRVRDNVGCYLDFPPITIGANDPGINAIASPIATACATVATGKAVIRFPSPVVGIGPFSYNLDNLGFVALNDTIRNLDSGFHSIVIRDALGCNITLNPEITFDPGVSATGTPKATACATATTGQIFVSATAGIAPFTYSIDNAGFVALNDTIRNLDSGIHNIVVRDAVGCTFALAPDVPIGPGVNATATAKVTACATASTGQIFVSPTAGIAPFTYSIDNAGFVALNDTIRNLDSGIHNIVVRDAVGCTFALAPDVLIGPGVNATATTKATACATATTGQIFVSTTAGLAPFTYSIDNAGFVALNDTIRNLDSGIHNIVVRDGLGCTFALAPDVPVGPGVNATFTTKATECATATTGQIFITPTAGLAPFTYSINSSGFVALNDTIRNLGSGPQNIIVRDILGCEKLISPQVPVGAGVTATATSVNAACLGISSGKIIVTPTAGTAPYTYTIGGAGPFVLDTVRNLSSGDYTDIILRDAVGCSYNVPLVKVNNDVGVTARFSPVNSACSTAATGAIIVNPLTGTPPFKYSLDGGTTPQTDSVFRSLAGNAYTVWIKDAQGCILNSPQNVGNNPGVLTNVSTIQNASCASIPNGSIAVNVTAGIAPFSYVVTAPVTGTPQSSNLFTSLFADSYDITITDSAGCTKAITSVVGSNPKVKIDSFSIARPTCNGLPNGSIAVHVSLGVSPYQYAIDADPYSTSKSFASIGAGVHTLHVRDANNCSIDSIITITEPVVLTNAVTATAKATCSGNPDGRIDVSAAGGTPPYQYTLDAAGSSGYQAGSSFNVLKGNYAVTASDANGCKATVNTVIDSVFTMYLDLGTETTVCSGSAIILTPNTNPETNIFSYSPSSSLDKADTKNPAATPTDTTTYTLTAQWGICKLTDNVKVNVLRKPVPNAGAGAVICFDTTAQLRASASNLSGTVNYLWSPASLIETKADTTFVTVRPKEEYTYFKVTVTDNYNCNFAVTDSVLVHMLPEVYAFAGNDTNAVLNKPHQLTATGAGTGGSYIWDYPPGVTLTNDNTGTPTALFIPVPEPGSYVNPDTNYYYLNVIATNAAGCSASDTIKINVFIGPTVYVPSAFSPNGDGLNDLFKPVNVGVNVGYFRIFNRYGEVVYETSQFRTGWDGMFKGKPQPVGAYVWIFRGKDRMGREVTYNGTIMLVR